MSILKLPEGFTAAVSALKEPVTLVLNDATRPSPASYVSVLQQFLPGYFRILFATGTHREVSEAESHRILGTMKHEPADIRSNDCDDGSHVFLGKTSSGTPVEVHPWLLQGSVLAVNTVEPHYFAGFTGGRKSFLPGCSSRSTVVANHFLACLPGAIPGRLKDNPVNSDMMEGVRMLLSETVCLMINGVAGGSELFCGSPEGSFLSAAAVSAERYAVRVRKEYQSLELVPGGGLHVSLYQAMKAVFMWADTVSEGGDLVLNAECPEGLGAPQMDRLLEASKSTFKAPSRREDYLLGDHAALRLSRIRKRIRLSFRTGLPMERYGFAEPPASCSDTVTEAGFFYPLMDGEYA